MKILLSAYSCSPNIGSEKQIGWDWVKVLSKTKHKVYVITRKKNEQLIKKELKYQNINNINFLYFDYPKILIRLFKNKNTYIYYLLWQLAISIKYRIFIKNFNFDYIHHVTYGSFRMPSFLWFFSKKFIFGPVAAGESVPKKLLNCFSKKARISELLRTLSNYYINFSILMNLTFIFSYKIYVTSKESFSFIPKRYQNKTRVLPAIFCNKTQFKIKNLKKKRKNIFFSGRLVEWKGVHLLKDIFLKVNKFDKSIKLNIYGDGYLAKDLKLFFKNKNLQNKVSIFSHLPRKKFLKKIKSNDLLIFPTFRDSGGYVLVETLLEGVNIITTSAGGPNTIIKTKANLVKIHNNNSKNISDSFANKIISYYKSNKKFYVIKLNKDMNAKNKMKKIYN